MLAEIRNFDIKVEKTTRKERREIEEVLVPREEKAKIRREGASPKRKGGRKNLLQQ